MDEQTILHKEHTLTVSDSSASEFCCSPQMALIPCSLPSKLMSFLSLLVVLVMFISLAKGHGHRETTIVIYLQDLASGPNATIAPITGIKDRPQSLTSFGTFLGVDEPITEAPDNKSTQVGRAQGILVASALDGSNVHVSLSFVFTNAEYIGSSLEIQGASRQFERFQEVSVVSGTGKFRFARGYAILQIIFFDSKIAYRIIRCTIRLLLNS